MHFSKSDRAALAKWEAPWGHALNAAILIAPLIHWASVTLSAAPSSGAADWNNAFAADMLEELGQRHPEENFTFSPFSIVTAIRNERPERHVLLCYGAVQP